MPGKICHECGKTAPPTAFYCPECEAALKPERGDRIAVIADRVGRALGEHYRVEELVGKGGAAVVFRVCDKRLNRDLAAKVLNPDLLASVELSARFRFEAQTAARLNHTNIVPIYFVGGEERLPLYVMPLVEGESLRDRLKREGQLPIDVALGIAKDIASALDFAHGAGVVHRDVKPDNILLEFSTGRSLLMDFGIAKAFQDADAEITGSGAVVGTPHYLAPEQAAGEKDIDGRADVYSLGVVVYEMLAGRPPYTGGTPQAIFAQHITADYPSIEAMRPELPRALEDVLRQALAKAPEDRFSRAGELVRAFERGRGRRSLRTSGSTVLGTQTPSEMHLMDSLMVRSDEPSLQALLDADDIVAIAQASENVERFLRTAADEGNWAGVTEAIKFLRRRAGDPRPAFRDPPMRVLERVSDNTAVVEGLAAGWRGGDEQAQAQLEDALSAAPGLAGHLLDLAIRDRSAELMLLADRIGGLTEDRVDALARDTRVSVVQAFADALRESLRPTTTIERWLALVLQHSRPEARILAVEAAGARGGALAERIGRLALGDDVEEVRVVALRALGRSRRREALPDLARFLEHGTKPEQVAATEALGDLGVPASASVLRSVFERKRLFRKERGPLQEVAVAALARLPADVAGDMLRSLATDRNTRIARMAAMAVADNARD
ncbi:MAG: protein kinase [Gemmatimonadetes bacterium]|nr:protein kinase [Gemmatimonadota bacterium]